MNKRMVVLAGVLSVATASNALAQEKLIFSLQWIPNGNNFGVFAAKEQGFIERPISTLMCSAGMARAIRQSKSQPAPPAWALQMPLPSLSDAATASR